MAAVFVSHASADKDAAAKLCADLKDARVDTWASFKDIQPGADWNRSIEAAMEAATHVVVVTSEASTTSDYVRAEVEWALGNKKTVLPVLIESVKLPLRWYTLQYADLTNPHNRATAWLALVDQLPKNTRKTFEALLATASIEEIRAFLWKNPQILGQSVISQADIRALVDGVQEYVPGVPLGRDRNATLEYVDQLGLKEVLGKVDFFDVQHGTFGIFRLIYLLATSLPFSTDGTWSAELDAVLRDAEEVITSWPSLHAYAGIPGIDVTIELIAGRRTQWHDAMERRTALEAEWGSGERQAELKQRLDANLGVHVLRFGSQLRLMSYDRLLDTMP